ncbi:RagB/SusD family nutrient uptake outer membrane protein [Cochleicola gelatinilyticus]|uniref:Glycan metabolism protein RagB n=1 Tax=Cochleicola gelatinilyticus TaxID=1763537 RepID=A0A167JA57_9FLAO|nr:RagB/SusD family nutrient uptake outer membrane protein [Cochleicola gelatinilyticus]OAB80476.1 glycan metabolism protein RagB [Cochleicola gelatinilyticus]
MKNIIKQITTIGLALFAGFVVVSCSFEEVIDPNGPSVDGVASNASKGQLNELVVGIESTSRNGLAIETTASGTMSRELYLFDADPRNTGDLLGKNGIGLDNNSFYSTTQWAGNYRCIKNANILIEAVQNTDAVTEPEANGYLGFAKTMLAYEMVQIVKSYGAARLDISDLDNLGPIEDADTALQFAANLLSEANSHLNNSGGSFVFDLSSGFSGFNTPETFNQFSQGVAGMVQVYLGNGGSAITMLNNSHLNLDGDLNNGPKHIFGLGSGDQSNGLFKVDGLNGDQIIVHNSFIDDADANDSRVTSKTNLRPDPQSQDDLNGLFETDLYETNTSPIDILRNEELILLWAEANILAGSTGPAEDALNVVRNAAGVGDYAGNSDAASLTAEMLKQRRYSLWCENHRMYDLRRYDLSNTLPIDRPGDQIFNKLPIPLSENI